MSESIMDAFQCNQCGALYDSEKELREHQQAAHHPASDRRGPHETLQQESQKPEENVRAKAKNA